MIYGEPLKEALDNFNLEHKVTSISYFQMLQRLELELKMGKIMFIILSLEYLITTIFFVSKKFGIFHVEKKLTSIQFIDKIHAVISTSDSLIRLVDMSIGKILYQYKGFTNKNSMTRA
jgi:hypothetical protein